jgi:NitT/TauT family transport system substrate-binding protein
MNREVRPMTETANARLRRSLGALRTVAIAAVLLVAAFAASERAAAADTIRVAVLKFGTVNWLMDTIKSNGLDAQNGYALELVELAGRDATTVALQAGDVDLITADWFWALRARGEGEDMMFAPYSAALGALVVRGDSDIKGVKDLVGKKIGVAGGPLDKSWLLLRGYGEKEVGVDLAAAAEPVFGAPPLLNEQLKSGDLDAVLTYWHFAARLEGSGLKQVIGVPEMMDALEIEPNPPLVGFVWRSSKLGDRAHAVAGFMKSVVEANRLLATSDAEWDRLRPLMQIDTDAEFAALKARYREGMVEGWTAAYTGSAEKLYDTLEKLGGETLVGPKTHFEPSVFWMPSS